MAHSDKSECAICTKTPLELFSRPLLDFQFHIVRIFNFQFSFYTTSKLKIHTLGAKGDSHYKINSKKGVLYI
jgi:hypothetical protein